MDTHTLHPLSIFFFIKHNLKYHLSGLKQLYPSLSGSIIPPVSSVHIFLFVIRPQSSWRPQLSSPLYSALVVLIFNSIPSALAHNLPNNKTAAHCLPAMTEMFMGAHKEWPSFQEPILLLLILRVDWKWKKKNTEIRLTLPLPAFPSLPPSLSHPFSLSVTPPFCCSSLGKTLPLCHLPQSTINGPQWFNQSTAEDYRSALFLLPA